MRAVAFFLLFFLLAAPPAAAGPPPAPEAAIRDTISRWYEELRKKEEGRPWMLTAPGFIEASPHSRHVDTGARNLGPRVYVSLAARAPRFAWEVEAIRRDARFARVQVWERGHFRAAGGRSYENGAAAIFVLERQEKDGRWLILAHETRPQRVPPGKAIEAVEAGPR